MKTRLLKYLFIILIVTTAGVCILQLFFPEYMAKNSSYPLPIGWQREIAFWNIAIIVMLKERQ